VVTPRPPAGPSRTTNPTRPRALPGALLAAGLIAGWLFLRQIPLLVAAVGFLVAIVLAWVTISGRHAPR
jgi:hypothetical protein